MAQAGIDERLRTVFVVYLIGHNRPFADLLAPAYRELAEVFRRGFAGMTETLVALDDLVGTHEALIAASVAAYWMRIGAFCRCSRQARRIGHC